MKKITLSLMVALFAMNGMAQVNIGKDFSLKIYGHVRTDLFYNSRANTESVDGLFYSFPKDKVLDANGKDINGSASSNMYAVYSRMGFDFAGPMIGNAKTSAKIEFDFRGNGNDNLSALRLRHAYFNFDWGKNKLLVGQTSHPFFGEVSPQILNLNTGSPFQPFGRAPQIRYRYNSGALQLQAAALWQSQFKSYGPVFDNGVEKSPTRNQNPHKNSNIPELALGIDYKANGWIIGVGIDMLSIVPRINSHIKGEKGNYYKVDERLTTVSYEAHIKYQKEKLFFAAKSTLGSNFTHTSMLGGYGIKSENTVTGEREYTPFRNSSNWINIVYGKKWKPGIFIGYIKNFGTSDDLINAGTSEKPDYVKNFYGTGKNIDQLLSGTFELTYNVPHWKVGFEYNYTSAWYGTTGKDGKVSNTHSVGNNRLVLSATYSF